MYLSPSITLLLSVASVTVAQTINDLPACASAGALAAIGSSGCDSTDVACICQSRYFTSGLQQYAKQNCSPEDYDTAVTTGQALCAQAGVTISSSSNGSVTVDAVASGTPVSDPSTLATVSMSNATVTTTRCSCEDEMPTFTSAMTSAPVATFTGAAVKLDGNNLFNSQYDNLFLGILSGMAVLMMS